MNAPLGPDTNYMQMLPLESAQRAIAANPRVADAMNALDYYEYQRATQELEAMSDDGFCLSEEEFTRQFLPRVVPYMEAELKRSGEILSIRMPHHFIVIDTVPENGGLQIARVDMAFSLDGNYQPAFSMEDDNAVARRHGGLINHYGPFYDKDDALLSIAQVDANADVHGE